MPRHAHYVPHGVIPAVLLPFMDDLAIDENSFRKHLRDVAVVEGLSAVTINAARRREWTPSFSRRWTTCVRTVATETRRWQAISRCFGSLISVES